jgi:hypothetical protein
MNFKSILGAIGTKGVLGYLCFLASYVGFLGASDPGSELGAIPLTGTCLIFCAISLCFLAVHSWKNTIAFIIILTLILSFFWSNGYRIAILDATAFPPKYFGTLSSFLLGVVLSVIYIVCFTIPKNWRNSK